jgi:hypothetical protein
MKVLNIQGVALGKEMVVNYQLLNCNINEFSYWKGEEFP